VNDIFSQQQRQKQKQKQEQLVSASSGGQQIDRILIFDWDIHHGTLPPHPPLHFSPETGDGVQELFYEDDRVLYVSIHNHEHQPGVFYDSNGEVTACGCGKGLGYTVNIPLPYRAVGDASSRGGAGYSDHDYDYLLKELVIPLSRQFDPQLVVVAAGFDACAGDPVGGNRISPEWFGRTTSLFQVSLLSLAFLSRTLFSLVLSRL
jgi:histone deacetylase 6